ncbi:MAG: hypothetical protein V5783_06655 [Pontiella sp.]
MKRTRMKGRGAVKGAPSGFVISLMVHAAACMLAGLLVVFTVQQKDGKTFVPPKPVDRPKMKLKKPTVKVKKAAKPKLTQRIVTKVKRASMPEIQLPEMSGMGVGIVGDIGGFDMVPDLTETTIFGGTQTVGSDFEGTFYDFNRTRNGRILVLDSNTFKEAVGLFTREEKWNPARFGKYYRSPRKLYASTFMIPMSLSALAPLAFGESDTEGKFWLAHYKGKLVHREGITFRFWGHGDDILIVRVNGEIVLNAAFPGTEPVYSKWDNVTADDRKFYLGSQPAAVGNWITLEPGVPLDMEVVLGEVPGGKFCAMLLVEEMGVEYERNRQNGPILPIFKTAPLTLALRDKIASLLYEGEASLIGGPVFNDYYVDQPIDPNPVRAEDSEPALTMPSHSSASPMRTWTDLNGKSFEGQLITAMTSYALIQDTRGKEQKIKVTQLSEVDREFLMLARPPQLNIDFRRISEQRRLKNYSGELSILDNTFGARVKQTSAGSYDHELHIQYFAIGKEISGDKYMILSRGESRFIPSRENNRSHEFFGEQVTLLDYDLFEYDYGTKYRGYLITVTDERGKIIQYSTSSEWLFEHLAKLEMLPTGSFIDNTCTRVLPSAPKTPRY